jgi:hypothetical protein
VPPLVRYRTPLGWVGPCPDGTDLAEQLIKGK